MILKKNIIYKCIRLISTKLQIKIVEYKLWDPNRQIRVQTNKSKYKSINKLNYDTKNRL